MWSYRHGNIISDLIKKLDQLSIRYFILRNYEFLPNVNKSKDVDLLIDPKYIRLANDIINEVYKIHGLSHIYLVQFTWVYCWRGMDIKNHFSIHIDLIAGYRMKGYEVYSFDELYKHTISYNGFCVLNRYYEGLMVLIYKQFGYKNPCLKQEYKDIIYNTYKHNQRSFEIDLKMLVGYRLAQDILLSIKTKDFDRLLSNSQKFTSKLKQYSFKKAPIDTSCRIIWFYWLKFKRIIISRKKFGKSFSVMAPDGAGKTTFLDSVIQDLCFYYLRESEMVHVLHFRPGILPNLGAIGEKAGMMKEDKNFSMPHRAKPAGFISSLFRITYYWFDYVIGWYIFTSKDIQYDRFTVYDRYSFDLIVDPSRTRLKLPFFIRKLFVYLMPHPKITFYLDVDPEEIYRRKQELTLEEINLQVEKYRRLVKSSKEFIVLDGNQSVEKVKDDAIHILMDYYCTRIK